VGERSENKCSRHEHFKRQSNRCVLWGARTLRRRDLTVERASVQTSLKYLVCQG